MPKSKLKKDYEKKKSDEKKEAYYQSILNTLYKNGMIPISDLKKLPMSRKKEYIKQEIEKKYGKGVSYTCEACAEILLYNENAYITDDELVEVSGAKRP